MAKYTEDTIRIKASPMEVWRVLTDPAHTPKYMFGCKAISTWKVGDPLTWKGVQDGVVYVKGEVVVFEPGKKLAFTIFDPQVSYPDIPENYLTATYTLRQDGGETILTVTQGDYDVVAEGEQRYEDAMAQGGWMGVLEGIRGIVEGELR